MNQLNPIRQSFREPGSSAHWEGAHLGPRGPVFALVPAHGESKAGAVQEILGRTWSEDFGLAVLLMDFAFRGAKGLEHLWTATGLDRQGEPGRGELDRLDAGGLTENGERRESDPRDLMSLLEHSAHRYQIVCADLTEAPEELAFLVLHAAHSIFVVSDSDRASLEKAREKICHFQALGWGERCGLFLRRAAHGLSPDVAEDLVGVPVCGMLETQEQAQALARWLATPQSDSTEASPTAADSAVAHSAADTAIQI